MDIRFVSSNRHKIGETTAILKAFGIRVIPSSLKINELQTEDVNALVRDKVLKAFKAIGRPVFVEHTGLHLPSLNTLPGGLTQIFWDRLDAERFSEVVHKLGDNRVIAKTVIGYCDARVIHYFDGEVQGTVPLGPTGAREFQWDCVFIPDGYTSTFAELGERKNEISMRRIALNKLGAFLKSAS